MKSIMPVLFLIVLGLVVWWVGSEGKQSPAIGPSEVVQSLKDPCQEAIEGYKRKGGKVSSTERARYWECVDAVKAGE